MTIFLKARVAAVGPEVMSLLEGGILILYGIDAPPDVVELSVLHRAEHGPTADPPPVGATIHIGATRSRITAMGDGAWRTLADIGHAIVSFNGATVAERTGEICAAPVDQAALARSLSKGAAITFMT